MKWNGRNADALPVDSPVGHLCLLPLKGYLLGKLGHIGDPTRLSQRIDD